MFDIGLFTALGVLGGLIFSLFILWAVVWKGIALWISAREKKKWWFVAMLIINTVGILEIIYVFIFSDWGKKFRNRSKK